MWKTRNFHDHVIVSLDTSKSDQFLKKGNNSFKALLWPVLSHFSGAMSAFGNSIDYSQWGSPVWTLQAIFICCCASSSVLPDLGWSNLKPCSSNCRVEALLLSHWEAQTACSSLNHIALKEPKPRMKIQSQTVRVTCSHIFQDKALYPECTNNSPSSRG